MVDPKAAVRNLLKRLPQQPESIELPAHVFRLFVETLQLSRTALLLPDYDEGLFVAWASVGLDATTIHRLRIPDTEVLELADATDSGIVLRGNDLEPFSPYFSRRESSMLEQLLLFPLCDEEGVQALLLIAECPYFREHEDYLRIILAAVGEPAATRIAEQRVRYSRIMRHTVVFRPDEVPVIAERIRDRSPRGIALVVIDFGSFVDAVAASNSYLDPFRIWQDILRVVASLFSTTGSVCDASAQRALLFVHGATEEDLELAVTQAATSIAAVLPEVSDAGTPSFVARHYPDDGDDILELIRAML
jgi:hypothetical protein